MEHHGMLGEFDMRMIDVCPMQRHRRRYVHSRIASEGGMRRHRAVATGVLESAKDEMKAKRKLVAPAQ